MRRTKWKTRPSQRAAMIAIATVMTVTGVAIVGTAHEEQPSAPSPMPAVEIMDFLQIELPPPPQTMPQEPLVQDPEPTYYDIPLDHPLQDVTREQAEANGIPTELLLAMMDQESDYRPDLVSGTSDYGIMQINAINHDWLRETLGVTDFLDPEQSIACGAYMIGELVAEYDGDLHHALTAYNRGRGGAAKYHRNNGTYETSYSRSILGIYNELKEVAADAS